MRLEALPDLQLWVQALPSADLADASNAFDACARVLVDDKREQLLTGATLAMLSAGEWERLQTESGKAFAAVCPTFTTSDVRAWVDALKAGAPRSGSLYHSWVGSFDLLSGFKDAVWRPRLERLYGRPLVEMLDGHHLCALAVRELLEK